MEGQEAVVERIHAGRSDKMGSGNGELGVHGLMMTGEAFHHGCRETIAALAGHGQIEPLLTHHTG